MAVRLALATLPTPLHHVDDLGAAGLGDLWLKRDDLTGFAWGGNKVRTVDSVLTDLLARRADTVIVAGGPTSNFAALLAIAAAVHGIEVHQIVHGAPRAGAAALAQARRAGAHVEFTGSRDKESMEARAEELAAELTARGRQAYAVRRGGATPAGALGFAAAAPELAAQLDAAGLDTVTVVLPVGSGGSIGGLLAGFAAHRLEERVRVVGVAVTRAPDEQGIALRATETAALLGAREPSADVTVVDGRTTQLSDPADLDGLATRLVRGSGFVADPVYNAKALLWLSRYRADLAGPVVYWSTGGLLAAADALYEEIT